MDYWNILGIAPTTDTKVVKKAYSALLKKHRPDQDAEGYQRLRTAFDWAMRDCRSRSGDEEGPSEAPPSPVTLQAQALEREADETPEPIDDGRDVAKLMQANARRVGLGDKDSNGGQSDAESAPQEAAKRKKEAEQQAYADALSAAQRVFNAENLDDALAAFDMLINEHALINLKTRTYFQAMSLNALCKYPGTDMPYALVYAMAKEFHWFEEQFSDTHMRQQIGYLEARLNTHRAYINGVITSAQSGATAERFSAKLLLGNFRPIYFHFLRFMGNYNSSLRRMTRYYGPAVQQDMCPELNTNTFLWWSRQLERSLYSLWHIAVAIVVLIFFGAWMANYFPEVPDAAVPYAIVFLVLGISTLVWAAETLYLRYRSGVLFWWLKIKGLYATDFILSATFVGAVYFWRYNRQMENIHWMLVLALAAAILLFSLRGTVLMLFASGVYAVCYTIIDVLDRHPGQLSYALVYGFISHKVFSLILYKLPTRISQVIYNNIVLHVACAGVVALALSVAYLKMVIK